MAFIFVEYDFFESFFNRDRKDVKISFSSSDVRKLLLFTYNEP